MSTDPDGLAEQGDRTGGTGGRVGGPVRESDDAPAVQVVDVTLTGMPVEAARAFLRWLRAGRDNGTGNGP